MTIHAPRIDVTGLHSVLCECQRCESGFRPSTGDRERAAAALRLVVRSERKARSVDKTREHLRALREDLARALAARDAVEPSLPPAGGFSAWLEDERGAIEDAKRQIGQIGARFQGTRTDKGGS